MHVLLVSMTDPLQNGAKILPNGTLTGFPSRLAVKLDTVQIRNDPLVKDQGGSIQTLINNKYSNLKDRYLDPTKSSNYYSSE